MPHQTDLQTALDVVERTWHTTWILYAGLVVLAIMVFAMKRMLDDRRLPISTGRYFSYLVLGFSGISVLVIATGEFLDQWQLLLYRENVDIGVPPHWAMVAVTVNAVVIMMLVAITYLIDSAIHHNIRPINRRLMRWLKSLRTGYKPPRLTEDQLKARVES